ncbi:MAG: hypothetical protein ACHQNE_09880, partial [Candidatus Kapaibacterium sp.]
MATRRYVWSRFAGFLVFGSLAIVILASPLRAQDPMAKWKPDVGDRFECQVKDYSSCGDYGCVGTDTILFEIVDTASNVDIQHPNAVLAATSAVGLHLYSYAWGAGWDSTEVVHFYTDTTLVASTGQRLIETSFEGYNVDYHSWSQI